jgi:hypothetical protein
VYQRNPQLISSKIESCALSLRGGSVVRAKDCTQE